MRCPICRDQFIRKPNGKTEVYEIQGKWYCSRACAIKGLYQNGSLTLGAGLHSTCNQCHKKMSDLHVSGIKYLGLPYCSEECLSLALNDTKELVIKEVSDKEMHEGEWRYARKPDKDEHGVSVSP